MDSGKKTKELDSKSVTIETRTRKSFKLDRIKKKIVEILSNYEDGCSAKHYSDLEQWISSHQYLEDIEKYKTKLNTEKKLDLITNKIQGLVSLEAVASSEKIVIPEEEFSDVENVIHVDDFLYEDDDIERCFGRISKYCKDCGSNKIEEKEMISHSLSKSKLRFIFNVMLPPDLSEMKLLDVGSRIGAVLYGAYFYSNAKQIYGVEINDELCEIQNDIVTSFDLSDRIKVIQDDILNQSEFLNTCDIFIFNNVFEYFLDREEQIKIWRFVRKNLKKGSLVVTVPSIEEVLQKLDILEEFIDWLKPTPFHQEQNKYLYELEDEINFHELYLYTAK